MNAALLLTTLLTLAPEVRANISGKVGACLGDSISMTSDGGTSYCVHWAEPGPGRIMVVKAMSGVPTNDVRYLQHRDRIDGMGFNVVLVGGGTNDCTALRSSSLIIADLQATYTALKADGVERVIAINVPPLKGWFNYTTAKGDCIAAVNAGIAAATNVDCKVDIYSVLEDPTNPRAMRPEYDSGDHQHPNDAGKRAMAAAVLAACGPF